MKGELKRACFVMWMGAAFLGAFHSIAACGSSDDGAATTAEAGAGEASATPPALSKYRAPTEAGSSTIIQFGEAGAPTACAAHPSPNPDIVRACVLRSACIPDQPPYKMSDCISRNLVASDDNASCVESAKTCADMSKCLDQGFFGKACAYGDHGNHCYDNTIVYCDDPTRSFYDCTKEGKTCLTDDDASTTQFPCLGDFNSPPYPDPEIDCSEWNFHSGACTVAKTAVGDAGAEGGEGGATQNHSWNVYCYKTVTLGVDCTALGKVCVPFKDGADCRVANNLGTCATPEGGAPPTTSCSGSSVVTCDGRKESHDCAAAGLNCVQENGEGNCLLSGCNFDDAKKCEESCDGPYANLCVGGGRYVVDCRQYGFARCQTYTSSQDIYRGDYAECVLF